MPEKTKYPSLKEYAKRYAISVIADNGKRKSVNELAYDIWDYESRHKVKGGMYPFLTIS
jgi:hypothetical protein